MLFGTAQRCAPSVQHKCQYRHFTTHHSTSVASAGQRVRQLRRGHQVVANEMGAVLALPQLCSLKVVDSFEDDDVR
jgi:hypothetical protein